MEYVAIASTAVNAFSALTKGDAQSKQYEASATASEYNAAVARQRAETIRTLAKIRMGAVDQAYGQQEESLRRQSRIAAGERRAAIAQSGTGIDEGSNYDVERQNQVLSELDALNIRYAGQLEKHDIETASMVEASDLETQANLDTYGAGVSRMSARNARSGGYLGAVGALLTGYGDYTRLKRPTTPSKASTSYFNLDE